MLAPDNDLHFMQQAIAEAKKAEEQNEIPVGAIIVMDDKIIARGHNQVQMLNDCTAHAEMIALTSAFSLLNSKYLPNATLYVTLEPCCMCAGALFWSKIKKVVYAADDGMNGFTQLQKINANNSGLLHPKTIIKKGLLENECNTLLRNFFLKLR
jgi:tRNA(adenine34) deaminase